MLVHPDLGGHLVRGGVLVIMVGGTDNTPIGRPDLGDRRRQVIDPAMEIVGRAEENDWAGDVRQVHIITDRGAGQRIVVGAVADPATGRRGGPDPVVGCRGHHRELAAHRVAVHAEPGRVHFRLLLEKRQRPARGQGAEEPVAVARRVDGVECPGGRFQVAPVRVVRVTVRRVVGVERAPVGDQLVMRVIGLAIPEQPGFVGRDPVIRRLDPAAPADRDRGIPAPGIGAAGLGVRVLPAAM